MESSKEITLKNRVRAKKIAEGLLAGMTYTAIAKGIGLSRNQIHSIMRNEGVQDIIIAEITERETRLQTWIDDLHNSPSPANQRHAVSEEGKMIRHAKDKAFPSLFRTETLNVNIDLTQYLQEIQTHTEIVSRMPPHMRTLYKEIEQQIKQEHQ